ncbi:MAG: FKBP-type peptidyl-prolyl cis-trans isomerase [Maricaulaceae bacterium]
MSQIIGFHYTLKDKEGVQIDSSVGRDPLLVMTERQQIIPGLEAELLDMKVGDKKTVIVAPKDGYGEVDESLRMRVPLDQFPKEAELKAGLQFQTDVGGGQIKVFTVMKTDDEFAYVDGNDLLAGKELHFDVEITEKRAPSEDELAHGHAHGVGGHQH